MSGHATESQHDLNFCESAVMLATDSAAKLLCGLRGGTVVVFDVTTSGLGTSLCLWASMVDCSKIARRP